jgi:hypothetical protein
MNEYGVFVQNQKKKKLLNLLFEYLLVTFLFAYTKKRILYINIE